MKTARSTTNTISVNHKISQTVLYAAQITAVAFLTLVLVVGLQAVASSPAHADTCEEKQAAGAKIGCGMLFDMSRFSSPDEEPAGETPADDDSVADEEEDFVVQICAASTSFTSDGCPPPATGLQCVLAPASCPTEDPVDEDPVDEGPVDEDPVDEDPADEDPALPTDDDTTTPPATDAPPTIENPVDPVDEDPVGEGPVDEGPVDEDPALLPDPEPTPEPTPDPEPTAPVPFSSLDVNVEQLVVEIFPQGVISQESPADPKDNFSPEVTPKSSTPEPPRFSPGNDDATPLKLAESGLPVKAIGAAATIMLIVGGAAGAAAAGSGGAGIWGVRGGVFAMIYRRVIAPFITRRCDECHVELRYKNGAWVEIGTGFTHGIHNHQHTRATAALRRKVL